LPLFTWHRLAATLMSAAFLVSGMSARWSTTPETRYEHLAHDLAGLICLCAGAALWVSDARYLRRLRDAASKTVTS
jgi:hypothetical protein